jgi:hypothetical protein
MMSAAKIVIASLTFLFGVGVVVGVDSFIAGMNLGEIPVVQHKTTISRDDRILRYVLSRKIDFRINDIGVSSPGKEITRKLGRAQKIEQEATKYELGTERSRDYYYDGLFVGTRERDGKFTVDTIKIDGSAWRFQGIGIGSSIEDVTRAFGNPTFKGDGWISYDMLQTDATLHLKINDDVVTEIEIGYGRC